MKHTPLCIVVLMLGQCAGTTAADPVHVAVEADSGATILTIHCPGGQLNWAHVVRGLARVKGFDDQALAGLLPEVAVPVDSGAAKILVSALDAGLRPGIRLEVLPVAPKGDLALRVTLDGHAMLATRRHLKAQLQKAVSHQAPQLLVLRAALAKAGQTNRFVRLLGPRRAAAVADLSELVDGPGDGAVSVARGRLEGVADTVLLPFPHIDCFADTDPGDKACQQLRHHIPHRLAQPLPRGAD